MTGEEKVWVEAEQDGQGGIALTLVDVAERRRLVQVYGHHVVSTTLKQLKNFPPQYEQQLRQGYPVRFKMNTAAFVGLLDNLREGFGPTGFEGAGDDTAGGTYAASGEGGRTGLGDLRRPRGEWALVRGRGLDDDVISVHKTQEQAENAMRKRGGEPRSHFTSGMRVVNIGPASGNEMIEVMGKWTIRPRGNFFGGRPAKPSNELDGGDDIFDDDDDEEDEFEQEELADNAVIQETRGGYELIIDGKLIEKFTSKKHDSPLEAAFQYARMWMNKNKYWPNLYFVNERGNVDLIDHQTGKIIRGWV